MIVIYAEKGDMGCKFAAALGGIPYNGKKINIKEYESLPEKQQKEIRKKGYIEMQYKNKDFIVTWGAGHFGTLLEPRDLYPDTKWKDFNLPIIPDTFKAKLRDGSNKYQFEVVKRLFNRDDCEYIINATDYEREGELIFSYTYELTGSKKPYRRVRINETTEEGIKKGFSKRYSNLENLPKEAGAKVRGIADWITGMNLTIAATTRLSNEMINTGRVITPTLAMIVNRENEITNFVSQKYYTIFADFTTPSNVTYRGKYIGDTFKNKEDAVNFINTIPKNGKIENIEKKKGKKMPEKPFDTLALQTEANKRFKFSLKHTDDLAQALYSAGYITYPRVDSRYLTEDQKSELPLRIKKLADCPKYKDIVEKLGDDITIPDQYFNNSKVDAHYAIIATGNVPSDLSDDEWKLYDLIVNQTIALAYPPLLLEKTKVITKAGEHTFDTTGTVIIDPGWTVLGFSNKYKNDVPNDIFQGLDVTANYTPEEGETTPPSRYNPGSLVKAMQTCGKQAKTKEEKMYLEKMKGLGRPSTRAGIVERLIACKYIDIKKNIIHPTSKGQKVIEVLNIDTLKSPELSAQWEKRIDEIEQSDSNECLNKASSFITDISNQTKDWVKQINEIASSGIRIEEESSFVCPVCSSSMKNAKYSLMCECGFSINKKIASHKLTKTEIDSIIKNKRTPFITDFKSKEGKPFAAYLVLQNDKIIFSKDSLLNCPKCGKPLRPFNSQKGYYCSGWQKDGTGCDFRIFREVFGVKLKAKEMQELIQNGETSRRIKLKKRDGTDFKAKLFLDDDNNIKPKFEV